MVEEEKPIENKSFLEKIFGMKKSYLSISKEIKSYQNSLNKIADEIVSIKSENVILKEDLFNLREENKRLNDLIMHNKDKLE
jgi:chromosome segregation ATPase